MIAPKQLKPTAEEFMMSKQEVWPRGYMAAVNLAPGARYKDVRTS